MSKQTAIFTVTNVPARKFISVGEREAGTSASTSVRGLSRSSFGLHRLYRISAATSLQLLVSRPGTRGCTLIPHYCRSDGGATGGMEKPTRYRRLEDLMSGRWLSAHGFSLSSTALRLNSLSLTLW